MTSATDTDTEEGFPGREESTEKERDVKLCLSQETTRGLVPWESRWEWG